ncbi:MAG: hypothetical protein ACOY40_15480, partial [Bacillota bacterium]
AVCSAAHLTPSGSATGLTITGFPNRLFQNELPIIYSQNCRAPLDIYIWQGYHFTPLKVTANPPNP